MNILRRLAHPSHTLSRVRHYLLVNLHGAHADLTSLLQEVGGASEKQIGNLGNEFSQQEFRSRLVNQVEKDSIPEHEANIPLFEKDSWHLALYYLIRIKKPKVVVETGVASGISSAFILQAMQDNGCGNLYSIDLPTRRNESGELPGKMNWELPGKSEPGFVIPEDLRGRWQLELGPSQSHLPSLLESLGSIDIFLHDSDHSYEYMLWEYQIAWPFIKSGGLLLSDDAGMHSAMLDFCRSQGTKYYELNRKFGASVKAEQ